MVRQKAGSHTEFLATGGATTKLKKKKKKQQKKQKSEPSTSRHGK
jgi:uncharacterized membrane protein